MLLKNCKIISSEGISEGDILIKGDKIAEIGRGLKGDTGVDVKGKPVIPGIVDIHVHMRDFEQRYEEDFVSGSKAALAGGITTFVDMPNSSPAVVNSRVFKQRLEVAGKKSLVDFGLNFGVTAESLDELKDIIPAFCKIYMDGALGEIGDEVLRAALTNCGRVAVHAEDETVITENIEKLKGKEDPTIHSKIREPRAEEKAVEKICGMSFSMKKSIHICHVSLKKSLNYLNPYTTCEVTPHHLLLNGEDFKRMGGIAKVNPPLRSPQDVRALWEAVKSGRVNIIASDHAPHREDEKEDVSTAPSGIPNLDVMLRLFLNLVNKGTLTLNELVRLMCTNPAKLLELKKGEIKVGNYADILVLDMDAKGIIEVDEFYSKAKYSPFEGWRTLGNVEKVFLRGEIAFDDGDFVIKQGHGKWIGGL